MKNIFKSILVMLLLLTGIDVYAGGGSRNGAGGATELLIPVGSRGLALNGSNISAVTGLDALFWNPAGIAIMDYNVEASFSHMNYIADIGVNYGAVSTNVSGLGVLSLSIKSLSVGEIDVTTVQDPDGTGSTYTPQLTIVGLSYARRLSDRISVGLTGNIISENFGFVSASGIGFNAGVMYSNLGGISGVNFAVVMKNIGPQMKFDGSGLNVNAGATGYNRPDQYYKIDAAPFELPSSLEIGLSYVPQFDESNKLLVSTTFENNNFASDQYRLGMEYTYNNIISLRGGYSYAPDYDAADFIYGFTAGVGLNYSLSGGVNIRVDYAFREVKYFDSNHAIGITLGF